MAKSARLPTSRLISGDGVVGMPHVVVAVAVVVVVIVELV